MQLLLCVKDGSGGVGLLVACMTFWLRLQILLQLRQNILCFFSPLPFPSLTNISFLFSLCFNLFAHRFNRDWRIRRLSETHHILLV